MILYSDYEMIIPEKKILLPEDMKQQIILPENIREEQERREFMLFSLACMGMMVFPTKSKANPIIAGLGLAYSIFQIYQYGKKAYKYAQELFKIKNSMTHLEHIGNARVPKIGIYKNASYNKKSSSAIAEKLSNVIDLTIRENGVHSALKYVSKQPEFWDERGYAQNRKKETYMNRAVVYVENKTNKKIERPMQLILVDRYGKEKDVKQFTLVANKNDTGTFNLSKYFRELNGTGLRSFEYAIQGNRNGIQIHSKNKNIVVSKFLA